MLEGTITKKTPSNRALELYRLSLKTQITTRRIDSSKDTFSEGGAALIERPKLVPVKTEAPNDNSSMVPKKRVADEEEKVPHSNV